jgi:Zn ribbon nucleic-acid-binding protein
MIKSTRREYQKRNLIFWGLFLGYVPGVLLIGIPLGRLLNFKEATGLIALAWMLSAVIAGIWRVRWKCPRCQKGFYTRWWYYHTFATKCVNCGFRPAEEKLGHRLH